MRLEGKNGFNYRVYQWHWPDHCRSLCQRGSQSYHYLTDQQRGQMA